MPGIESIYIIPIDVVGRTVRPNAQHSDTLTARLTSTAFYPASLCDKDKTLYVMIMREAMNMLGAFLAVGLSVLVLLGCSGNATDDRSTIATDDRPTVAGFVAAVTEADVQRVQMFLKNGIGPNDRDSSGTTPFVAAVNQLYKPDKRKSPATLGRRITPEESERWHAEWLDLRKRRHRIIQILVDHGADVDAKCLNGTSPLLLALDNLEPEIAELLLKKGTDASSLTVGERNEQALAIATTHDYVDVAILLIQKGADVNERHRFGFTPLMQAAKRGHVKILKALIDAGANVDAEDKDGNTALMQTVEWMGPYYSQKVALEAQGVQVSNRLLLDGWETCPRVIDLLIANGADTAAAVSLAKEYPELAKVLARSIRNHNKTLQRTRNGRAAEL